MAAGDRGRLCTSQWEVWGRLYVCVKLTAQIDGRIAIPGAVTFSTNPPQWKMEE